jgi:saccharopine dehydrogenase-like NADP-dependent oxidoreductase
LGGRGKAGTAAIELLAQSEAVTGIAVVGRNLERAEEAAREIGEKGVAVQADGTDEQDLASLMAG